MGEKVTDASRFFQISKYLVFWRPVLPGNPSLSPHGRCFNWETLTQGMFWHSIGLNWNEAGSVMVVPSQVKRTGRERERRKEKAGNARGGQVRHWSLLFRKEQETGAWARLRLKSPFFLGETPICHHLCWGHDWDPKTSVLCWELLHSLLPWSWNEFRVRMEVRQVKHKKLG